MADTLNSGDSKRPGRSVALEVGGRPPAGFQQPSRLPGLEYVMISVAKHRSAVFYLGLLFCACFSSQEDQVLARYEAYIFSPQEEFADSLRELQEIGYSAEPRYCTLPIVFYWRGASVDTEARRVPCIGPEDEALYLPPFYPLLSADPHDANIEVLEGLFMTGAGIDRLGWSPVSYVKNGLAAMEAWENLAKSGELFGCKDAICLIIVESFRSRDALQGEEILSLCLVHTLDSGYGPPEYCMPISVTWGASSWIVAFFREVIQGGTRGSRYFAECPHQVQHFE